MIGSLVLAVTTAVLPLAAGPVTAAPAAVPAAACPSGHGVTVVVDFGTHGGTTTRCAPHDPSSASEALTRAGFDQERVQHQPGFLCRIDGVPGVQDDGCVVTPPESAYWSFWTARRGGTWGYQNAGIDGFDPPEGSVIGFAFGSGATPRTTPPLPPAPRPSATRTAPASTAANGPSPAARAVQPGPTLPPSAEAAVSPTPETASPLPTASESSPHPASPETSLAATPTAALPDAGEGRSVGTWVGVGAVVLVAVTAWANARRRRR